jgi:hypothetical protein
MTSRPRGLREGRAVVRRTGLSLLLGTAMLACMAEATCALTCAGRTSLALASVPPLAEPDYRQTVTEPAFGASITRVTDPGRPVPNLHTTWGAAARHRYSSAQAWNADQSLLMLGVGASGDLFLDGRTYTPLFRASPPGGCEWHPTDPRRMICVDGESVLFWDPSGGTKAVVFSATDYHDLKFGPGKGNPSRDGRYVAVRGEDAAGGQVAFALDLERGVKFADIQLGALAGENSYVSISPTGHYVFVFQETPSGNQGHVFTREGAAVQHWLENHRPGHGDMTIDDDGQDVMVGISKSPPDKFRVIKRRLSDGQVSELTGPGLAQHVSARNIGLPGWVIVTYGGSAAELRHGFDPLYQEVDAVRLDGSGQSCRIAPTRSVRSAYRAEAQASPSPDGSKIVFASNWGDPSGPVAAYVAEPRW